MAGVIFKNIFKKNPELAQGNKIIAETELYQGVKLVQSEIQFLLETERNKLFFGNSLGADLDRYLFLMNNQAAFNLIKDELEILFIKYKKAYLQKITMGFDNLNKQLKIDIEVSTDARGNNLINIPLAIGGN